MDPIRKFAERIERLEKNQRKASSTPQLGTSSIQDGTLQEYDAWGNLVGAFGRQVDGTHTLAGFNGPIPPAPTVPTIEILNGSVRVSWDGKFADGSVAPMDLDRIDVHIFTAADVTPLAAPSRASIMAQGWGDISIPLIPDTYMAALVAWTRSGKYAISDESAPFTTYPITVDLSGLETDLAALDVELTTAQADINTLETVTIPGLDVELTTAQADLVANQAAITAAEADIVAAQAAVLVADGKGQQGIDDAADAISAAVIDATQKMNTRVPNIATGVASKVFRNLFVGGSLAGANASGYLVIRTPIAFGGYMTQVDISGFNYEGASNEIKLRVMFSTQTSGIFTSYSYTSSGSVRISQVQLAKDAAGKVVIIASILGGVWQYPAISIDRVAISYQTPPDSFGTGWTAAIESDLTPYTLMRTNLCGNPNFETNTSWWTNSAGAIGTRDTSAPIDGTASLKVTGGAGAVINTSTLVVAGETYTLSADYKTVGTVAGSPNLALASAFPTTRFYLPKTQTTAGRFSVTATATGSGNGQVALVPGSGVSDAIFFDNILFEKSATANPYFDGSTPPAGLNTYAWTGAPNASTSTHNSSLINAPAFDVTEATQLTQGWRVPGTVQIDGGDIYADSVTAVQIAAQSILAEHMVIASFDNLVNDPTFKVALGTYWESKAGVAIAPTAARDGGPALQITTAAGSGIYSSNLPIRAATKVEPGASYRISVSAKTSVAVGVGVVSVKVGWKNTAGTDGVNANVASNTAATVAGAWTTVSGIWTAPADAASMAAYVQVSGAAVAVVTTFDFVSTTRAANASLIVDGAIIAGKIAAGAVSATELAAGAVVAGKIAAGTIVAADIAAGAITTPKLAAGAVTANEIGAGAITTLKLAAGAVTANEIGALAITTLKLAAGAVTTLKLAAGAVTADEIGAGAITTLKLAAGAVTANEIGAGAITANKILAGAIDAMTITGPLIRTAASGQRMEFTTAGLVTHDAANAVTATLGTASGGLSLTGNLNVAGNIDVGGGIGLLAGGNIFAATFTEYVNLSQGELRVGTIVWPNFVEPSVLLKPQGLYITGNATGAYVNIYTDSSAWGAANINASGSIQLRPGGVMRFNMPAAGGLGLPGHLTNSNPANMFLDGATNWVYRSTSSARYKTDLEPLGLPSDAILGVEEIRFHDKAEVKRFAAGETYEKEVPVLTASGKQSVKDGKPVTKNIDVPYAEPKWIPGFSAEQVHAAGLGIFVTYDELGRPDAVSYDRMLAAALPLLRQHHAQLADFTAQFATLTTRITTLEGATA